MIELRDEPFKDCKSASLPDMPTLYYKPEKHKSLFGEFEIEPSKDDLMHRYFVSNKEEVYGYYCGLIALNHIHGTTQVPAVIEIKTNKISEDSEYVLDGIRYIVYKSDKMIDKSNSYYLKILDTIEDYYNYFEDDVIKCIKWVVKELKLNREGFVKLLLDYSDRTKEVIENVFKEKVVKK